MRTTQPRRADIARLLDIMARLRAPETGCPWDLEQNFRSIAPYTIEEAYEVADAIEREALDELKDELGDLLFQVVFHAQMAREAGAFAFDDVVAAICDKMIRRHPHVFGDAEARDADAQTRAWEEQKAAERAEKSGSGNSASLLDDLPVALPALTRAAKLQKRMARGGFDWPDAAPVLDKIREEIDELAEAQARGDAGDIEDEFGDLLFALVNYARHNGIDPEAALRATNAKVEGRFRFIEEALARSGRDIREVSLDELEALWQDAKSRDR